MCKEINKLIKIIFVCIVHPRQHFPLKEKTKGQNGVPCSVFQTRLVGFRPCRLTRSAVRAVEISERLVFSFPLPF